MRIHAEYIRSRRRIYLVGGFAVVGGLVLMPFPVLPGFVLVLAGLSILSLQSRTVHQFLAKLRARHPSIGERLERAEAFLFRLVALRTHNHDYVTIPGRGEKTLSGLVEVSELGTGVAVILHSASMVMEAPSTAVMAEAMRARGLTVLRFDAYHGMGESGGPFANFTATSYCEDLEDVLAWARQQVWWREPLVLVGHSVGGLVAARYAQMHPDTVHELYLIAPNISGASYESAYKAIDPDGFAEWEREGLRTVAQPLSRETYGIAFTFVEDLRRYDLMPEAGKLTMPVFVYIGDSDNVTPVADVRAFTQHIGTHASLTVLPDVGHVPKHHDELITLRDALLR